MKPTFKCAKSFLAVVSVLSGAAQNGTPVDELLRNHANDNLAAESAGRLVAYGADPRAVPALRAKFLNTQVKLIKQSISLAMLKLKVADPAYFDYLASFAWEAVNDDAPSIFPILNGQPEKMNPEFARWCKLHGKDFSEEIQRRYTGYPTDMIFLIWAHDERAAPIFRKGLLSSSSFVVDRSANGLGDLGNPSDIESIIEAARRIKADINPGVARALAYFRNPRDREAIAKQLQGSRLYDNYLLAVKVDDKLRASVRTKPN